MSENAAPSPEESAEDRIHRIVEESLARHPGYDRLSETERTIAAAALEGASRSVVELLARLEAACQMAENGMVPVAVIREAIRGGR